MNHKNYFDVIPEYQNLYINKSAQIDYSDGPVENYILDCLNKVTEEPYTYWENNIVNWPTEYHFSWARTNLLSPINFNKTETVLELGGGTGILTHYMAPKVKEIISYEGSLIRGKCISKRCSLFQNVQTIVSNFENVNFLNIYGENSFDVITLIGVLEYTNKYFKNKNGIKDLLDTCNKLLKPDGVLVIAIENKLGLKYLLGWEEDHVAIPNYGIEEKYGQNDVITFGYAELQKILSLSSFTNQKYLFPFPDYKLPSVIIVEDNKDFSDNKKELFSNLLSNSQWRNYSGRKDPSINASRVVNAVLTNDMLSQLSNSFLVFASKCTMKNYLVDSAVVYYFSVNRRFNFANKITFFEDQQTIYFKKDRLASWKNVEFENSFLTIQNYNPERESVTSGVLLSKLIEDAFVKKNYKLFEEYINRFILFLYNELKNYPLSEFDLMPFNIIVTEQDTFCIIDGREWKTHVSFSVEQIVVRFFMLHYSYSRFFNANNNESEVMYYNQILRKLNLQDIDQNKLMQIKDLHNFSDNYVMARKYQHKPVGKKSRINKLKAISKNLSKRILKSFGD
jgi:SAM-dependent methyltransferase